MLPGGIHRLQGLAPPALRNTRHGSDHERRARPVSGGNSDDLKEASIDRFGILSTGDWTLVASFDNPTAVTGWSLRSTAVGVVVGIPASQLLDQAEVVFGRVPDLSDRQVEVIANVEPCLSKINTPVSIVAATSDSVGYWCAQGIAVRVEGPRSYVDGVVASLRVNRGTA